MARRRCSWNPFDNKAVIRSWRTPHRTPRSGAIAQQDPRRVQGEGGGSRLLDVAEIRADLNGCRSEARLVRPVRIGLRDLRDDPLKIGALRSGVRSLRLPLLPLSMFSSAPQVDFEQACGRATLPVDDDPERVEQRPSPGSNRSGFLGAGHRRCPPLVRDGGDGRHRARGGGDVSSRRLLGAHLPAASPERRETVAAECLGCRMQFAVDVRLPLPARCSDCGADVLARSDIEAPAAQRRLPFDAPRVQKVKR